MLRGRPDWRRLVRAISALLVALWLPVPYGAPLLAAAAGGSGMSCCRHKTECCCRKQKDPARQTTQEFRPAACANSCKIAALSGPVAPILVVAAESAPVLAVAGAEPPPPAASAIASVFSPCLYQRPPPFLA